MRKQWTDREISQLRLLYGHPEWNAKRIARMLGKSKSAVIGKADRLGMSKPSKSSVTRRQKRPSEPPPLAEQKRKAPPPVRGDKGCKWPMWPHDSAPTHEYCGLARKPESSYCLAHHKKSVQVPGHQPERYRPTNTSHRTGRYAI